MLRARASFTDFHNSGSVKSNIGHLEGGSGLAGIAKSVLILEKGFIPPNALFERLNTKVNAKRNNIQVIFSLTIVFLLTSPRFRYLASRGRMEDYVEYRSTHLGSVVPMPTLFWTMPTIHWKRSVSEMVSKLLGPLKPRCR